MDNLNLDRLLVDLQSRNFWLKSVGFPQDSPHWNDEELRTWEEDPVEIHFNLRRRPDCIQQGDILIAYRVRIRKVIYIAECSGHAQWATDERVSREPNLARWRWFFHAKNWTPDYGSQWNRFNINPFNLARRYNASHPNDQLSLGAINFGSGHASISRGFAEMVIREIRALPSLVPAAAVDG
jgi:hypothetical protein